MARPIRETPILFGKNARRFEALMRDCKPDYELSARVMEAYRIGLEMLKRGEEMDFPKVGECKTK